MASRRPWSAAEPHVGLDLSGARGSIRRVSNAHRRFGVGAGPAQSEYAIGARWAAVRCHGPVETLAHVLTSALDGAGPWPGGCASSVGRSKR